MKSNIVIIRVTLYCIKLYYDMMMTVLHYLSQWSRQDLEGGKGKSRRCIGE